MNDQIKEAMLVDMLMSVWDFVHEADRDKAKEKATAIVTNVKAMEEAEHG